MIVVALITVALSVDVRVAGMSTAETLRAWQLKTWSGPETRLPDLDSVARMSVVAVSGTVLSTSTYAGDGRNAGVVFTACRVRVDQWIGSDVPRSDTITV